MTEARIVSLANLKGGVGKTATSANISYNLSKLGYKVLVLDMDPQANMTQRLLKTANINKVDYTLTNVIFNDIPLNDVITNIKSNLDLVPSAFDIYLYERYLSHNYDNDQDMVRDLNSRLIEVKSDYDFIIIDTPPALSQANDNVFWCCDYIITIMASEGESYQGTKNFANYVQNDLIDNLGSHVQIMAVLPVLMNNTKLDKNVLNSAINYYGNENVFSNHIKNMQRVKRMYYTGITDNQKDIWDQKTNDSFMNVTKELIERLN